MTYGALNTVTTADVQHAREAINDVSNVGLLNWERQSLKPYIQKVYVLFDPSYMTTILFSCIFKFRSSNYNITCACYVYKLRLFPKMTLYV